VQMTGNARALVLASRIPVSDPCPLRLAQERNGIFVRSGDLLLVEVVHPEVIHEEKVLCAISHRRRSPAITASLCVSPSCSLGQAVPAC